MDSVTDSSDDTTNPLIFYSLLAALSIQRAMDSVCCIANINSTSTIDVARCFSFAFYSTHTAFVVRVARSSVVLVCSTTLSRLQMRQLAYGFACRIVAMAAETILPAPSWNDLTVAHYVTYKAAALLRDLSHGAYKEPPLCLFLVLPVSTCSL